MSQEYRILLGLNVNNVDAEDAIIKYFEPKNITSEDWDLLWLIFADLK